MSAWESEPLPAFTAATAAPHELFSRTFQWKRWEAHSHGSTVYGGVSQRWSAGLGPSSPARVCSMNSLQAFADRLSLSLAGAAERGKG